MAFNFKTFAAVGALIGSLALVGCGQDEKDPNHIKVGVIVGAVQQDSIGFHSCGINLQALAGGRDIRRRILIRSLAGLARHFTQIAERFTNQL